jgi:hypothetical protein
MGCSRDFTLAASSSLLSIRYVGGGRAPAALNRLIASDRQAAFLEEAEPRATRLEKSPEASGR